MKFTEDALAQAHRIQSYDDTGFLIQNKRYDSSVLVSEEQIDHEGLPSSAFELTPDHFSRILAYKPQVLIIGTGAKTEFLKPEQLSGLYQAHIGVETMTTAAACRTFNLLLSEGRRVMALLLLGTS